MSGELWSIVLSLEKVWPLKSMEKLVTTYRQRKDSDKVTHYRPSPILFNIVFDMLAIMIERVKLNGQIEGVVPHLVDGDCLFSNMWMMRFYLWNMKSKKLRT